MNVCDNYSHEEIVYTGRKCPLCEALETIAGLESQVADLEANQ